VLYGSPYLPDISPISPQGDMVELQAIRGIFGKVRVRVRVRVTVTVRVRVRVS
jgi:hypothetical protein